jgi:hypothetical protein
MDDETHDGGNVFATAVVLGAIEIAIGVITWLVWRQVTG